jgi:hypothetical protein
MRGVWCRLGLCVVFGACGFHSPSGAGPGGDDTGSNGNEGPMDAGIDAGASDGPAAANTCWSHWMDGTVAIVPDSAKEITELTSVGTDRNPWISSNGLTMYFSRDLGNTNGTDAYIAKRTSPTGTFDGGARITNVSTPDQESRVWLTSDELMMVISSDHAATQLEIHMDVRGLGAMFATPTTNHLIAVNMPGDRRIDPWLSDDGLHLYWAANNNNAKLQILTSTRATSNGDFGTPAVVGGFPTTGPTNFADPTLYQNEQLILFSTSPQGQGAGTGDLWYARRASVTADFEAMTKIPVDTDTEQEFDPVLSADGCELYYASDHGHTNILHLFHATIAK